MDLSALTLALSAGALAALNPCGFALLPAYLSLLVLPERHRIPLPGGTSTAPPAVAQPSTTTAVLRALRLTTVMTAGFLVVFAGFGLVVAPLASSVQQYLPWVTLAMGILLVALGGWLLTGRDLPTLGRRPRGPEITGDLRSTFLFGVTYALASLTCTVAPFLALVVTALRSDDWGRGMTLFAAYAVGMGLVVGVAAVAVAIANARLVGRMRGAGRWVPRAAGALLLLVGAYVAYYGWWEIRVLNGGDPADPVVEGALEIQAWLSGLVRAVLP